MAWIRSLFLFSWLSWYFMHPQRQNVSDLFRSIFLSILAADLHGRIEFNDVCPGSALILFWPSALLIVLSKALNNWEVPK
jgi:hypothetical protein